MQILSIFSIFSKFRLLIKLSHHQFAIFKNNLYLWYNVQYFREIKLRVISVKRNLKKLWNDMKYWYLSRRVESLILVSLLRYTLFFFLTSTGNITQYEIIQWGPKYITWFGNLCLLPWTEYQEAHLNRF